MIKYFMAGVAGLTLMACSNGVIPAPSAGIPAPATIDNTEMCALIDQNEKNLRAWVNYGNMWAVLFGVDLNDKIAEFEKNIDVLSDLKEARNVACVK